MGKLVNATVSGLWVCAAAACYGANPEAEVGLATQDLASAGAAAAAPTLNTPSNATTRGTAAATEVKPSDGFSDMRIALLDKKTARLSVRVGPDQIKQRKVNAREPVIKLAVDDQAGVELNDMGKDADVRAGDGLFSGRIPIDVDKLTRLNSEIANTKQRTAVRFAPGSHEALGRIVLPSAAIDIEKLKSGAEIALPPLGDFGPFTTLGAVKVSDINPQKSLLITSLPVIEDPANTMNPCNRATANNPLKVWTFGHLMEQMSQGSGLTPSAFVESWLGRWLSNQTVNATGGAPVLDATSSVAAANMNALVINPWRARSGGGALDLRIAPFRLQGIFYRPDLGGVTYSGANNSGGELRFVFGLMEARDGNNDGDALDAGDTCQVTEMAVIFEYGVPIKNCMGIKAFANKFVDLSNLLPGTPAYSAALSALTESVVAHGAAPGKPNQNALNQLRSNEIDLTGIWQFREFVIRPGNGPLVQTTAKNNPRQHMAAFTAVPGTTPVPFDGVPWVSEINTSPLPELSGGLPFLSGGVSYFPMSWDDPSLSTPAQLASRFNFSLNTCSSCHTEETDTSFYHVRPAGPGATPVLSSFLNVSPFTVTDVRGLNHTFQEKDARKQALANLANSSCGFGGFPPFEILHLPLKFVH
jgi:hypothetical protein